MKKVLRDYLPLLVIAGLVIALDQVSKSLVRANLAFGETWSPWPWLEPYARLIHIENTGAAFGMLQGLSVLFGGLAVLVSLAILYYYPQVPAEDWPLRLAMGMQLGGALGNLIDRIRQGGAVTDWVSVGNFAVFNVADASISLGVVVLILGMWFKDRQISAEQAGGQTEPGDEPPGSLPDDEAPPPPASLSTEIQGD